MSGGRGFYGASRRKCWGLGPWWEFRSGEEDRLESHWGNTELNSCRHMSGTTVWATEGNSLSPSPYSQPNTCLSKHLLNKEMGFFLSSLVPLVQGSLSSQLEKAVWIHQTAAVLAAELGFSACTNPLPLADRDERYRQRLPYLKIRKNNTWPHGVILRMKWDNIFSQDLAHKSCIVNVGSRI